MPYNTRRKSLSLSELGIQVPKRARAQSQASPLAAPTDPSEPPSKKVRCVPQFVSPPGSMSPPKTTNIRIKTETIKVEEIRPFQVGIEHTPPPSPRLSGRSKVSTEGIKDEVVVGVILQLEKTGNRPHTSKELAACLANVVPTIDTSTNPNALIQARLATYIKGPWPLVSPCPIGKEQENIHPRRVFYFLSAIPHQPIPDTTMHPIPRRIISPALSSSADEDMEDKYNRQRTQLSPSPEVDLSSPDLDDDNDIEHQSMYSSHSSLSRAISTTDLLHNRRAASPPLEREERDFKQTANELQQQRRDSQQRSRQASEALAKPQDHDADMTLESVESAEESEEAIARRNHEAAAALFGGHEHLTVRASAYELSSPVLRPQQSATSIDSKAALGVNATVISIPAHDDVMDLWSDWETKSPENIELHELECLLDAY